VAVPDPPGGVPAYGVGEPVTVGDTTFTFSGITERDGAAYLTFSVESGDLEGAQLMVGETIVPVTATDGGYEAGPIDPLAIASAAGGEVTLALNDTLVPIVVSGATP
jgi:hypothetical protein